jgi:hypothetical protein
MFEAVTVTSDNVDAGLVAEALVYYQRVNVVVAGGVLIELIKKFGRDSLIRAIEGGALQLTYERNNYVVQTESAPFRTHSFQMMNFAKTAEGRSINSVADEIENIFERNFGKSKTTKDFTRKIVDSVLSRDKRDEIVSASLRDALDQEFITEAIRAWLKEMVPEYQLPKNFRVETADTGKGIVFISGLDFSEINKFYHRRIPVSHSSVTDSYLLAHIIGLRKEMVFGANADSDVWLGPGSASMLRVKTDALIKMTGRSRSNIETFHVVEFEGRSFQEVINNGQRSVEELFTLLETSDAQKFKAWLSQQSPDGTLIKEFDRAVFQSAGWTQKLPFKVGKIISFAGLGALIDAGVGTMGLATLATSGLSALSDVVVGSSDEFLLSKLLKGWKPNQFIDGPAKTFLYP